MSIPQAGKQERLFKYLFSLESFSVANMQFLHHYMLALLQNEWSLATFPITVI